jgi:TM2 domain-containing membrane protein YozV
MASPILAAILSFLIPGLGQAYAGDIKKGVIFFVIAVIIAIIAFFTGLLLSILSLIFAIYAAYDAYKMVQM